QMLYGKHLGLRGLVSRLLEDGDPKARELHEAVEALRQQAVEWRMIGANSTYHGCRARAAGDRVTGLHAARRAPPRFAVPRHPAGERLCRADYVGDDQDDFVAMFAVTCGRGIRELAESLKQRGEYFASHALQALAIESAEAFAEMLHARLRTLWGFPDPGGVSIADKLKGQY